ncbi:MAG: sugar ABC transporter permease [Phycisphaerae bacterium]|nr:MAG: sugar ABC transporter permease [Phycisphaerae bacterium]
MMTRLLQTLIRTLPAMLVAAVFVCPLLWMITTSIKPLDEVRSSELNILPDDIAQTPEHVVANYYSGAWKELPGGHRANVSEGAWSTEVIDFPQQFRNTVVVASLSTLGLALSSAIVAYGMLFVPWAGRKPMHAALFVAMAIPFPVIIIPTYLLFKYFGWIGTLKPLWLPAWFGGAFGIYLLMQFFKRIPSEYFDAGRIDGLSHWGLFRHIVVPLSKPAIVVVSIFHLAFVWNDFLGPLIFLHHESQFTLAIGLQRLMQQHGGTAWNTLMAACTISLLPLLLIFIALEPFLMSALRSAFRKQ